MTKSATVVWTRSSAALAIVFAIASALLLGACTRSRYEPPQVEGMPLMVEVDGAPVLWVLTKSEEVREVRIGGGRRSASSTRTDTYYHFDLRAYDPATTKPLWRRRLLTFGDPDARTSIPVTRVIGSSESGALLGQDGDRVWLVIGDTPFALSTKDGMTVADPETLERVNATLRGKLPSEARHYGFDAGLTVLAADAQRYVVRGPEAVAVAYAEPAPPPPPPQPASLGNSRRLVQPMPPWQPAPARMLALADGLVGLYSEKEARAAENDEFGDRLAYPYTILDEGTLARRTFWRVRTAETKRFDEVYQRIEALEPIAGAPVFLRGRFLKQLPGEEPIRLLAPPGTLVWHLTRADDAGRLVLTRLDDELRTVWSSELPLSESGIGNPVRYWLPGDRVVIYGGLATEADGVVGRRQQLVSVALGDGSVLAHDLTGEPTDPAAPEAVPES